MKRTRRDFLQGAAVIGAGALAPGALAAGNSAEGPGPGRLHAESARPPAANGAGFRAVLTPDVPDLAFAMDGGVKVFHLVA